MASIKVKFRPSSVADHEGTIYYQIIQDRIPRQILTPYHIFPCEWDEQLSGPTIAPAGDRRTFLISIRDHIRWDLDRLSRIVRRLDNSGVLYTTEHVIEEYTRYSDEYSLFNYMQALIIRLRDNGKIRTSETYATTLLNFRRFRNDADIMLDAITPDLMEAYEAWQRKRGIAANTVSFYTRILRAVYNRAVEDEIITNRYPFRRVYTGIDKTVKRALPISIIKKIKILDLKHNPALDFARDMFLMSFYLRGMSFIDMAYLRKTDLVCGYITYRRRKTGQTLIIKWTDEMQNILDKYPENESRYLLPIIRHSDLNERSVYRNTAFRINHNLKRIARRLGLSIPLTLYVARHSWASAARSKGIPISVISEGMGHENEATTRIYLASLDTTVVDRANSIILKSLR